MKGLEKAKDFFLKDSHNEYNILPFYTNAVHEVTGETKACFVKHLGGDDFYVIPSQSIATHAVKLLDGTEQEVRMMLRVGNKYVDLVDFHDNQGELRVTWTETLTTCF